MMKNILLKIEYDGSDFSGWQKQPEKKTIQGEVEEALERVYQKKIELNGTSRTDAGVHALSQMASYKVESGLPTEKVPMVLNNMLAGGKNPGHVGSIRILEAREVPEEFHARFDSKGKKYIYRILNEEEPEIFKRKYFYWVKEPLDIELMNRAASFIVGTHDFKCFESAGGNPRETTVRTVYSLKIYRSKENSKEIDIEIKGDGFLYNMVRNITGTLVEVGLKKRTSESLKDIIESKDRQKAGHKAPASGLYLAEVYYDEL